MVQKSLFPNAWGSKIIAGIVAGSHMVLEVGTHDPAVSIT